MGSLSLAIPPASTIVAGTVQLDTATNSTSTTKAATPSAVKTAVDNAAAAQTTANSASTAASTAQTTANGKVSQDNGAAAIGTFCLMKSAASTIASGATIAGSGLNYTYFDGTSALVAGGAASGTWRNVCGISVGPTCAGVFQRIA